MLASLSGLVVLSTVESVASTSDNKTWLILLKGPGTLLVDFLIMGVMIFNVGELQ